jgi:co-chaperonin GroES (HSP10)
MRKAFVATAVVTLVAASGLVLAHEGHEHKIMGKVVTIEEKKIEVESTDGKKVSAVLSADTKYLRDKAPAARADVKVGERVVIVVVEEKDKVQNVKQVLLGTAPAADHKD